MLPAYKVLYFGFLNRADQNLYMDILEEIYKDHGVGERTKARIQFFHQDLRKKGKSLEMDLIFSDQFHPQHVIW